MSHEKYISLNQLCVHHEIEISFFSGLNEIGLIEIEIMEETPYIHEDKLGDLEKMIRMHRELEINIEGIDTIFNLLKKIDELQTELTAAKNKLRRYVGDDH